MGPGAKTLWFVAVFALTTAVVAPSADADDPSFLSFGAGYYDFEDDDGAFDLRAEFRSSYKFLGVVKPWIGVQVTSDIASFGVAGILVDLFFGRRVIVTPSFGVGLYSDGDGKDLGNTVQFRSQIEGGYRFDDRSRLTLALSHISNAGLGDDNPGANILSVYYHIPLTRFQN
jgi:hypothetical protein